MRVLIIGINYRPEPTGIGPYTAGLAEHLASRGDEVTVLTGLPNYPGWRLMRGTPRRLLAAGCLDGVTVLRVAHYIPAGQSAPRRALYEGTFGLTGLLASLRLGRPDAILGVVPSLSGGILARLTGQRLRAPYGLLFQDLMGPAARQSGIASAAPVARATGAAEAIPDWRAAGPMRSWKRSPYGARRRCPVSRARMPPDRLGTTPRIASGRPRRRLARRPVRPNVPSQRA